MGARKNLEFLGAQLAMNVRAPMALRASFLLQMLFMMLNNMIFFTVWWIFFSRFPQVNGWGLNELAAMYGITAGAFGLFVVLGSGARQLGRKILDGQLDSSLVQPKNPLVAQIASYSQPSGWGDLISAFILIGISGYAHGVNLLAFPFFVVCGALIFMATVVLANSLAFWVGQVDQLAQQYFEYVVTFSVYPQNIFPLGFKFVLFTLIPAGFIGYVPIEWLREGSWWGWPTMLLATTAYVYLCQAVFFRGLRRYESGNQLG